ncbi:phage tail protein [Paenibacillus sp. W2I17]|uniref:phage tail protein n=1 Tax=Paenibacillus sp. W2I17 TaxID=3042311 RepID=UPI002787E3A6|nr:phage tail protein [Paenibacillus sp. W2I17]MDQ0658131.1 hypothetical protein [Paenibacillus sp. W2I17]
MPQETDRLKLPLPLGNERVTRDSISMIFEKIDAGVATQEDLDALREAVSHMDIPDASLTQKGKVQLSSKTDGTSETVAATEKAIRDARVAAETNAKNASLPRSGGSIVGDAGVLHLVGSTHVYQGFLPEGQNSGRKGYVGFGTPGGKDFTIANEYGGELLFRDKNGVTALSDLKQSVSNGKASIAAAITGKGVLTAANASFATMASNVTKVKQAYYQSTTSPTGFINSGSGVPFVLATFPGGTSIISAYGRTPIGSSIFNDRWSVQSKASDKFELRLRDANGVDWILSTHNYIGSNGTTNDSVNSFWSIAQIHVNLLSGVAMVVARVDSYVSWNNVHQGGYGYSNSTTKPNGGFDNSRNFSLIVVSEGSVNFPGNNSALIVESM